MNTKYRFKIIVRKVLFFTLIILILPGFSFGANRTPASKTDTAQPVNKAVDTKRAPKNPIKGIPKLKIQRAGIISLEIDTYQTGAWFWKATIKNTGTVELDRYLVVQGYKKSVGQNTWEKASKAVIGNGFMPNQTRVYKRNWARCCRTGNFKVDIRDNANNTILATKMYWTSLSTTIPQPIGGFITRIEWSDTAKQWRATLKNFGPWTFNFAVQGYLWHNGLKTPASSDVVTLAPYGEDSTLWLHATGAQNGATLKVHIRNLMPNCNESNEDCGFEQNRFIVIPNGSSF